VTVLSDGLLEGDFNGSGPFWYDGGERCMEVAAVSEDTTTRSPNDLDLTTTTLSPPLVLSR